MEGIEGKRVVVTGGTSGIGKEVARRLAALGTHVVLACRDVERAHHVARDMTAATGGPTVEAMQVDTSDIASVRRFATRYRETHGRLDVLVNGAGVLLPARQTSADGLEQTFATNVWGYHLVTTHLLDCLQAASSARVVNIASTFAFGLDLDDVGFERRPYDGMTAYAQSKVCDRLLTWAHARHLDAPSVIFNAMAPGLVLDTGLYRRLTPAARQELAQYGSRTIAEGADTAVWMASDSDLTGVSGRFFEQRAERPCEFRDEAAEDRLLQLCTNLVESSPTAPAGAVV